MTDLPKSKFYYYFRPKFFHRSLLSTPEDDTTHCNPSTSSSSASDIAINCSEENTTNNNLKENNMSGVNSVQSLYKEFKTEWAKPQRNLKKCGQLLDQLKVALVTLVYLPTGLNTASPQELVLARDVLEIGVEYSIAVQDIPAFERYMSQLKCYYYDYKNLIGESANMYEVLGLNLLFLLSQNRVAEFHTELELLPAENIHSNKFIRQPVVLEQYLMEGSYNKIFQIKGDVPAPSYNFFMNILIDTVRNEIAACLERAYEKISIPEGAKRLNLKTQNEFKAIAASKNWKLGADNFYHFASETPKAREPMPSLELAEQAIFYARELEMIV